MPLLDVYLPSWWLPLAGGVGLALSIFVAGHAILHKRDPRATVGWAVFVFLAPFVGPLVYAMLAVNRIRRRAVRLRRRDGSGPLSSAFEQLPPQLPEPLRAFQPLAELTGKVSRQPLAPGNRVTAYEGGDEAYPAMLGAIGRAQKSISLCTFIYDNDSIGKRFAEALGTAVERGVEVRVLVDAVGLSYMFPSAAHLFRRHRVPYAKFLPTRLPWRMAYMNLRNHRKILVADGTHGFTGGMNIRAGHMQSETPESPTLDTHFGFEGPVVSHLQEAFVEDWWFAAGERLEGETWFPKQEEVGDVIARGITDGPDGDLESLGWLFFGGISQAQRSVKIMTPYFLPDHPLVSALNAAALRGVEVDILIPHRGNLTLVQWATEATVWQVLKHGCRLWRVPPPFDHSKLMVVDDTWCTVGSGNWDARSLRLNFEFNVECYDTALAKQLSATIDARRAQSTPHTLAEADGRNFFVRLRDGLARTLTPYL